MNKFWLLILQFKPYNKHLKAAKIFLQNPLIFES